MDGWEIFNPSVWKPATPSRKLTNGQMRPGKPAHVRPLFPRYILVRFHRFADEWRRIRGLYGIDYIFCSASDTPIPVSDVDIDAIKATLAPNGCLYPENHHATPLPVNTAIRAMVGGADLTGVCTWSDGRRVELLMKIMGRDVLVKLKQADVEVI